LGLIVYALLVGTDSLCIVSWDW